MRLHFREKPWDLYAVAAYTIIIAPTLLLLGVGNLFAALLVVFLPGYVVMAALFPGYVPPDARAMDWVERLGISFGVSIAVVPLIGLLLNFTPWGLRFSAVVVTISIFTAAVGLAAFIRRMRLPPEQRLSLTLNLALPAWEEYSFPEKSATMALAASIVVAIGALTYVALTPHPGETFTEFYILGPTGEASGYPTQLNLSQNGSVIMIIANHEATTTNYTARVDLVGVRIVYNATSGFNETVEVNRTTWSTFNVTLADGRNWTQPYTFSIPYVSLWKVQFLLFKDGDFSSAYRELHLYVRVG